MGIIIWGDSCYRPIGITRRTIPSLFISFPSRFHSQLSRLWLKCCSFFGHSWIQGCCKVPFCRLRRLENEEERGHLARRLGACSSFQPCFVPILQWSRWNDAFGIISLRRNLPQSQENCWYSCQK